MAKLVIAFAFFCLCWEKEAPWSTRDTCAAMIYQCNSELQYFLSRYKYWYYDKISQKFDIQKLMSFMIPYPRQALSELCFRQRDMEKGAKFQLCFVLLCTPPFTYPSRWRHKSMHSCNSLAADTVLCTHGKKNMACLFFATLLCLSVVCNNVLYGVLYLGTCNKILYVSWEIVLLQPREILLFFSPS